MNAQVTITTAWIKSPPELLSVSLEHSVPDVGNRKQYRATNTTAINYAYDALRTTPTAELA